MIYKMPWPVLDKVTRFHSLDGKGIHVESDLDLKDFAKIIQKTYGLKDLNIVDIPDDDDFFDSKELYHYKVVNKKLFNYFVLRWA